MTALFTAVQQFDPSCGEQWRSYIEWSGLAQLREVVSLDGVLCPNLFQELIEEDWRHNVQEDFKTHLFVDLDHVLRRTKDSEGTNVLAVIENPTTDEISNFHHPYFVFRGFDLLEKVGGDVSALVNCGGLEKAFAGSELSACGLLTDHARALEVQRLLHTEYPGEHHADCDVWGIWQLTT
jgi:hypothetical protein